MTDEIKNEIKAAKENFFQAFNNLELNETENKIVERSVLDFAIFIALHMLELALIEKIILGENMPITKEVNNNDIVIVNWNHLFKSPDKLDVKFGNLVD